MLRALAVLPFAAFLAFSQSNHPGAQSNNRGWYRSPALYGDTIAFTAEGDLWLVGTQGGLARRLTSNPGDEFSAVFSPDGSSIAFSADYEGSAEIYTMPASGGLPVRRTYEGGGSGGTRPVGWTPDGKIIYSTHYFSGLSDAQLATIDSRNQIARIPLSQAAQGC